MPSITAKMKNAKIVKRTVLFVVYPQFKLLDLVGLLQVFSDAADDSKRSAYRPVIASIDGTSVQSDIGVSLDCESLSDWMRRQVHTLIIVSGKDAFDATNDEQLKSAISRISSK